MKEFVTQNEDPVVLRNQLNSRQLLNVLEMALAERRPLERAWGNYYHAPERKEYNDWLSYLELYQFQIEDINKALEFGKEDVQKNVTKSINKLRHDFESRIEKRSQVLENSWRDILIQVEQQIMPEENRAVSKKSI